MLSSLLSLKSLKSRLLKTPLDEFHSAPYLRHNQRRLEHLASLRLPISGQRVLEVGAGVGDHTSFFLDRGCTVLCTEGRKENLALLRSRFRDDPRVTVQLLDLEVSGLTEGRAAAPLGPVDIVYCYGVLYHLSDPAAALSYLARCTRRLLLLETSVSYGDDDAVNQVREDAALASQAVSGHGCRPTRGFVLSRLRAAFPHVYKGVIERWHRTWRAEVEQELGPTALPLDQICAKHWAWLAVEYHARVHDTTQRPPMAHFLAEVEHLRPLPRELALDEVFLHRVQRKVRKDGTVRFQGLLLEVRHELVGRTVELRFDPTLKGSRPRVFVRDRFFCDTVPLDRLANATRRRHRSQGQPAPGTVPSGLDPLALIEAEHYERVGPWPEPPALLPKGHKTPRGSRSKPHNPNEET